MGFVKAIRRALAHEDQELALTRWNDAVSATSPPRRESSRPTGGRLIDHRSVHVGASPERAFMPIRRLGGRRGWYFANVLWQIRSLLDVLVGGPGLRRGRRDPEHLVAGDTVDFWRVEACEPDRRLRLRAEMRLPGRAWLQFEVAPEPEGRGSTIQQTATFDPRGLLGRLYWYAVYPLHAVVFAGLLRSLARLSLQDPDAPPGPVRSLGPLAASLLLCLAVAAGSGLFTAMSVGDWYPALAKPWWTPPSAVFGPVWTVLYLTMGLALWLVWSRAGPQPVRRAGWLFGAQLALNAAWSPLFFGLRSPGAALVAIGALWLAIAATVFAFWRVERVAGALLLPYWAWVTYAAALNWAIWRLNP
jgi:tryptophan-rich sensory protein